MANRAATRSRSGQRTEQGTDDGKVRGFAGSENEGFAPAAPSLRKAARGNSCGLLDCFAALAMTQQSPVPMNSPHPPQGGAGGRRWGEGGSIMRSTATLIVLRRGTWAGVSFSSFLVGVASLRMEGRPLPDPPPPSGGGKFLGKGLVVARRAAPRQSRQGPAELPRRARNDGKGRPAMTKSLRGKVRGPAFAG
jgi:hypothetical protein